KAPKKNQNPPLNRPQPPHLHVQPLLQGLNRTKNSTCTKFPPAVEDQHLGRCSTKLYLSRRLRFLSFPNSVWERPTAKLCFAAAFPTEATGAQRRGETEFRGPWFPNGVWEPE